MKQSWPIRGAVPKRSNPISDSKRGSDSNHNNHDGHNNYGD
jgi:hypothetical protein